MSHTYTPLRLFLKLEDKNNISWRNKHLRDAKDGWDKGLRWALGEEGHMLLLLSSHSKLAGGGTVQVCGRLMHGCWVHLPYPWQITRPSIWLLRDSIYCNFVYGISGKGNQEAFCFYRWSEAATWDLHSVGIWRRCGMKISSILLQPWKHPKIVSDPPLINLPVPLIS